MLQIKIENILPKTCCIAILTFVAIFKNKRLLEKKYEHMSRNAKKLVFGVSHQVLHKLAYTVSEERILKFLVDIEEELYYPSSENKGADQLCSNCTADLRLLF